MGKAPASIATLDTAAQAGVMARALMLTLTTGTITTLPTRERTGTG